MLWVLGVDPGFAKLGLAGVELPKHGHRFMWTKAFETKKSAKKREILATEDNVRRSQEIFDEFYRVTGEPGLVAICTESQSWPRNASAIAKLGMFWGVLGSISRVRELPVIQATPTQIKWGATRDRKATKESVQKAIEGHFPGLVWPEAKTHKEHCADALGAIFTCLGHNSIVTARRFARFAGQSD